MKVRDLIEEMVNMEMEDEIRIYDADKDDFYETEVDTSSGYFDFVVRAEKLKNDIENVENVISQLISLKDHCSDFVEDEDLNDVWRKDIVALNFAIEVIKRTYQLGSKE